MTDWRNREMEKRKYDYIKDGHWVACQAGTIPQPVDEPDDDSGMITLLVLAIILLAIVVVVVLI